MPSKTNSSIEEELQLLMRQQACLKARDSMLEFCKLMMPDMDDPDDITKTEYKTAAHARMLCDIVERLEAGETPKDRRMAVSIPPQHGKTLNLSQLGLAWLWARNPRKNLLVITYNATRAEELGTEFRRLIKDQPIFQQIFPDFELKADVKSKSAMQNTKGGKANFIGVSGTITGRAGDFIIIDDPYKGVDDEFTSTALEKVWKWFYQVAYSRSSKKSSICVIHTRWHEDDLIGRLCDPAHPERNKRLEGISEDWTYMNIPGVIKDPELAKALNLPLKRRHSDAVKKQFGDEPMTALWPETRDLDFFAQWKKGDPQSFSALVMGEPTPDDGVYFTRDMIVEYDPEDLPKNLRFYGASDHAVSAKQERDFTVIGCAGIDEEHNIWIMPDLVIDRMQTDRTVEEILMQMQRYRPYCWWMESELISKSFGPFLEKRMLETQTYVTLDPVVPSNDKQVRARAIQGRMAMRKVYFPRFAPWWADAKSQILKFPRATNDDFVDWLSWLGLGLTKELAATSPIVSNVKKPKTGTLEWVIYESENQKQMQRNTGGW